MADTGDAAALAASFEQLATRVARDAPELTPVVRRLGEEIVANRDRVAALEERVAALTGT